MSANVIHLAGAGGHASLVDAVTKVVLTGESPAGAMWMLVPFAILSLAAAIREHGMTIYHVSFVVASVILVALLSGNGTAYNHLLDFELLTAALVAHAWRLSAERSTSDLLRPLALAAVVWGTVTYQIDVHVDTVNALRSLIGQDIGYAATPLAGVLKPNDRLLSEDPYVAVSRDEDPVVLDPYMLLPILHDHPEWQDALIRRIRTHRFDKIVLIRRLDLSDPWWRTDHLGLPVATAIARNYRFVELPALHRRISYMTQTQQRDEAGVGLYWVYVPRKAQARVKA